MASTTYSCGLRQSSPCPHTVCLLPSFKNLSDIQFAVLSSLTSGNLVQIVHPKEVQLHLCLWWRERLTLRLPHTLEFPTSIFIFSLSYPHLFEKGFVLLLNLAVGLEPLRCVPPIPRFFGICLNTLALICGPLTLLSNIGNPWLMNVLSRHSILSLSSWSVQISPS